MIPAKRALSIAVLHPRLRVGRRAVAEVVRTLDGAAARFGGGCPPGELSVAFLTDEALARLHGRFLDDPSVTDVITFEGEREMGVAGEVCISADAGARQAAGLRADALGRRRPADALSEELTLYVVHGWLHLAGYDDRSPADRSRMRRAERRAMRLLRSAGALPQFGLRAASGRAGLARGRPRARVARQSTRA